AGAINARQPCLHARLQVGRQRDSALYFCRSSFQFEFHQALKVIQNSNVAARFQFNHALHDLARAIFLQRAIDHTTAEQLLGFASGLLRNLHSRRNLNQNQADTCRAVSSAMRRWSSGVRILPVTVAVVCTTSRHTSRLSSAIMRAWSWAAASRALVMI